MKKISITMLILAIVILGFSLGMDTSVVSGSTRVHNIGLMQTQTNGLILGGLLFISGILLFIFSKPTVVPTEEKLDVFFQQPTETVYPAHSSFPSIK